MENQALFSKSINILLKTYQDGTLNCGATCSTTPVGHISGSGFWYHFFHTKISSEFCRDAVLRRNDTHIQYTRPAYQDEKHKAELLASGYSIDELAQIEWVFKTANKEQAINGIMAIIDTLITIHCGDAIESDKAKSMFLKLPVNITD